MSVLDLIFAILIIVAYLIFSYKFIFGSVKIQMKNDFENLKIDLTKPNAEAIEFIRISKFTYIEKVIVPGPPPKDNELPGR